MPQKDKRSYFVYPKTKEERREAFTLFEFAREQKIQQPQYLDENGTIWRWDNKGKGRFGLIQTNKKLARNTRDRARRLELSLTEQDFEKAFPGKGKNLYLAEKQRIEEIYANANDTEDVDHIWSLNSGGLNVSQNMRPLPSVQNRAEGDRGVPGLVEAARDGHHHVAVVLSHGDAGEDPGFGRLRKRASARTRKRQANCRELPVNGNRAGVQGEGNGVTRRAKQLFESVQWRHC